MSAFGQLPVVSYMCLTCRQASSWSTMLWYGSVSESESESESESCAPCMSRTHCARFSSSSLSTKGGGPSDSLSSPQPQSVALGESVCSSAPVSSGSVCTGSCCAESAATWLGSSVSIAASGSLVAMYAVLSVGFLELAELDCGSTNA